MVDCGVDNEVMDRRPDAKEANPLDTVFFLVVQHNDSKADLDIFRRASFGSDDDDDDDNDDDNNGGMRRSSNLLADAFITRTIFVCV
jgi:hypothetical protein